jgi:hypothetical protein
MVPSPLVADPRGCDHRWDHHGLLPNCLKVLPKLSGSGTPVTPVSPVGHLRSTQWYAVVLSIVATGAGETRAAGSSHFHSSPVVHLASRDFHQTSPGSESNAEVVHRMRTTSYEEFFVPLRIPPTFLCPDSAEFQAWMQHCTTVKAHPASGRLRRAIISAAAPHKALFRPTSTSRTTRRKPFMIITDNCGTKPVPPPV